MEPTPLMILGTLVCLLLIIQLVFGAMVTRSYVKVPAGRALVRTGGFFRLPDTPPRVVMNGGTWVFSFIHSITWVDLTTMNIKVERTGQNSLLTQDMRSIDIQVVFHVKVNPTIEGIIDAARTIGGKVVDSSAVRPLVEAKLNGALRDVIASFTFTNLHQDPVELVQEIQRRLKDDLDENGLILESVSVSRLKPVEPYVLKTDSKLATN